MPLPLSADASPSEIRLLSKRVLCSQSRLLESATLSHSVYIAVPLRHIQFEQSRNLLGNAVWQENADIGLLETLAL